MNTEILSIALFSFIGWGMGGFLAKLSTNRIGSRAIFWDLIGLLVVTFIYCLLTFSPSKLFTDDRLGILLAFAAGAVGALGGVSFYILISKSEASLVVPLTALYPALTAILAFIFLRESISITKVAGIILSLIALFLLSL